MNLDKQSKQSHRFRRGRRSLPDFRGKLLVGLIPLTLASLSVQADINWDGDSAVGNFSDNFNWFGNVQPTWGFSSGNLIFNFRNSINQTSLFYDYGVWNNINDIVWETTFGAGLSLSSSGATGINFNQRIENRSSFAQTVTMPISGAKNSATQIEFNPVNADLTLNGAIFNDNNKPYYVFGNNGKTLNVGTALIGTSAVSLNLMQNSTVVLSASNTYSGDTNINAGTLQFNTGGSASSSTLQLGDSGGTASATISLGATGGGQLLGSAIVVRSGSTGSRNFISNNTATNTWSGNLTLNADLNFTQSGAGMLALTGTTFDLKAQTVTFNTSGGGTITVSNAVGSSTGTGNIRKSGNGYLVLSSANTINGSITIEDAVALGNAGVVIASANNALGTSSTVNLRNITGATGNVPNNAELRIAGVSIPSGVTLNVTSGDVTDHRTTLSNSTGVGAWNGPISLTATHKQTFQISSNGTDFNINNSVSAALGATGSLWVRGAGSGTITGNVSLNSSQLMQKLEAGTWTVGGNITAVGLNVAGGLFRLTTPIQTSLPVANVSTLGLGGNGVILEANGNMTRALGTSAGSLVMNAGTVSGSMGLSARGGALNVTIGAANSSIAMGSLAVTSCSFANNTGSIQVASTSGLVAGMLVMGANIPANATIGTVGTGTILLANSSLTTGTGSAASISFGAITGSGFSSSINTPTLIMNNATTANSDITLNNGLDIRVANATRTLSVGTNTATITGAITNSIAGNTGTLSRAGNGTLVMSGGGSGFDYLWLPQGRTDLGGTWNINRIALSGTSSKDVNVSGTVNLTMKDFNAQFIGDQTGSGVLNFNVLGGGAVAVDRTGGNERDFAIANGAGSSDATAVNLNLAGSFTLKSAVNMIGIGGSTRVTGRASSATITINNGGMLDVQGSPIATNKIYLGAASNINGGGTPTASTVQAGTVVLNSGGTLRTSRTITEGAELSNITTGRLYFNGGTLSATSATDNADWISGLATAAVQNGGAVIDTNGANMAIAQSLTPDTGSTGGLTKWGAGRLTLSGTNSYSGTTTVSSGTLLVNGTHTGGDNYTVSAGYLGGSGTLSLASGKKVQINAGGTLAPGSSAGKFTIDRDLSMANDVTATLEFEVGGNPAQGGTAFDLLVVSGNLTLTGSHLNILPITSAQLQPSKYKIISAPNYTQGSGGTFAKLNDQLASINYTINSGLKYKVDYVDNDGVYITFASVPEPGTLSLLAIGGFMLRRRRRVK